MNSCACGCGEPTTVFRGQPRRFVRGHNRTKPFPVTYVVDPTSGCWAVTGRSSHYAHFARNGRRHQSHVWMWEQKHGPVPDGLVLDHLCRNKRCVNPAHLEPVTATENNRRSRWTRLTVEKAREIRSAASTVSNKHLAQRFGVSESTISLVRRGLIWREENGAAPAATGPRHDSQEVSQ